KARPPTCTSELHALVVRDLHLRKKKTSAAEFLFFVARRRTTAIEPPIPQREDEHISQPEQSARAQEFERRFFVRWKRPDQESDRSDQRERGNSIDEDAQCAVERTFPGAMTHDRRHQQDEDERGQKPDRSENEIAWQRDVNSADGEHGHEDLPAWLRFIDMLILIPHSRGEDRC